MRAYMKTRDLISVTNNTKWDELRLAMYSLDDLHPKWRTKDVESGYISNWDGEWFYHFRNGGYESIEWVEIRFTSPEQERGILKALKTIHLPGERIEQGFRVFGYCEPGKVIAYFE
jgi:hypothetical protein